MVAVVAVLLLLSACRDSTPTSPSGPARLTVSITAGGVNPTVLLMDRGVIGYLIVTFANDDSEPHDIRSNPHPGHTTCAPLNLGVIAPGQRLDTPILSPCTAGLAGLVAAYHDETRPDDPRFWGSIH